jgi:hypothetical protein
MTSLHRQLEELQQELDKERRLRNELTQKNVQFQVQLEEVRDSESNLQYV